MGPENPEDGVTLEGKMNDAIRGVVGLYGGSFATKWVTCVEIIDEDGERGIWTFVSPDAKRWDIQGLLKEVENFQTAHTIAEILEEHKE